MYHHSQLNNKNNMKTLEQKVEAEVREYSNAPILYIDTEIPKNHLYCVRGEHCDFYETSKYVMVYLKPKVWGVNKNGEELKEGDKISCVLGRDTWNTHVMYDEETKTWHRERDYETGKLVGSYIKTNRK